MSRTYSPLRERPRRQWRTFCRPVFSEFAGAVLGLGLAGWTLECRAQDAGTAGSISSETVEAQTPQTPAPNLSGLSLEELMDVRVTTVAREESTVGESPAAVFVITQEMIRRSGATTIAELFRMVPGMDVARVNGNTWDVSSRGFNNGIGKMLVQIDGRTLYTPVYSTVYWDTVDYPLEDIERIEIIRGPGASIWGANAVNGIINIITKSAKDTQGGLFSGGGGSSEQGFSEIRFGGKLSDNLYYRVYGKWSDDAREFSLAGNPNDQWIEGRSGMRMDWTPNTRDTFTLQGDWFESDAGQKTVVAQPTPPFSFEDFDPRITTGANVLGRWTRVLNKDSNFSLQLYWDHFDQDNGPDEYRYVVDTFDLDFHHEFALGRDQKIVYGLGYRLTEFYFRPSLEDNGFAFTTDPEHRNSQLFSTFVQDQVTIIPERVSLTLGSKFEHNDFTGFEIEPTGRLLWTPTKRQTVWMAVSRAVRTPGFVENRIQATVPETPGIPAFLQLLGNTSLESEKVVAYELGYRAAPLDKVSVDIATFYNVYDDLTVFEPGTPATLQGLPVVPILPTNRMKGDTYGAEVSATWQTTSWWQLYGAYTYLKMDLRGEDAGLDTFGRQLLTEQELAADNGSPQNQVYLRSSWDLPGHFEFDLIGRYVDRLEGFTPVIPNYITMDVRLAWKPRKNLEFSVVGQDLADNHHPETGGGVEIERSVYGKVTYLW